jgi:hypothetical protein
LILFILWSRFKIDISNSVHDFTLFKKNVSTLTLYTLLDALILSSDILFKINSINFIKLNGEDFYAYIIDVQGSILKSKTHN